MENTLRNTQITLAEAAQTLRMRYHTALNAVLLGDLEARRINGRWFVDAGSVEAYRARHAQAPR